MHSLLRCKTCRVKNGPCDLLTSGEVFTGSVLQAADPYVPLAPCSKKPLKRKGKRFENEYETARREALERMKVEEERRQLEVSCRRSAAPAGWS